MQEVLLRIYGCFNQQYIKDFFSKQGWRGKDKDLSCEGGVLVLDVKKSPKSPKSMPTARA